MKRIIILIITAASLMGCSQKDVYLKFQPVPLNGWDADSALTYFWTIDDTTTSYHILIDVRHTEYYPYQNLWFFIQKPNSQDTIEFYLADERGQWLGKEHNGYIEMPVLYEEAYRFDNVGEYPLSIQHGMRTKNLRGISDVGVIISKNEE